MSRGKSEPCVYCGKPSDGGRDHVPGKQFFPDPRPSDLITVPACERCNKAFKMDEDYARGLLMFGPAGTSAVGKKLWATRLHRAYAKDPGLRAVLARAMREFEHVTPAGLYLGKRIGFKIDWSRVYHVIEKWARGLYYFEFHQRMHPSVRVDSLIMTATTTHVMDDVRPSLRSGQRSWPGVFEYRCAIAEGVPGGSAWLFLFLGGHAFGTLTAGDKAKAASA